MDYFDKLKNYLEKRGRKKNMQDLVSLCIIGIIIVIVVNFFSSSSRKSSEITGADKNKEVASSTELSYEDKVKQELTDVLGQIEGAGKVKVMISFEAGSEEVPAFSTSNSKKTTQETDGDGGKRVTNENTSSTNIVTTNEGGGSKPFITKELNPKISGVIVIAEGASNPDVKYKLYEAVKTVFNIQQYRVNIYPMQKN